MKKKVLMAAVLAVVLSVALVNNRITYSVDADCANLAEEAARFWSRGRSLSLAEEKLLLHDSVIIGGRKFVLFELEEQLGRIELLRTFDGRWKIEKMGHGNGNFREEIIEEDGAYYLIFGGRNAYFGIHSAAFMISGTRHVLDVPQKDRFLVAKELEMRTSQDHVLPDQIFFYDETGADITDQVPWNSPGE